MGTPGTLSGALVCVCVRLRLRLRVRARARVRVRVRAGVDESRRILLPSQDQVLLHPSLPSAGLVSAIGPPASLTGKRTKNRR